MKTRILLLFPSQIEVEPFRGFALQHSDVMLIFAENTFRCPRPSWKFIHGPLTPLGFSLCLSFFSLPRIVVKICAHRMEKAFYVSSSIKEMENRIFVVLFLLKASII